MADVDAFCAEMDAKPARMRDDYRPRPFHAPLTDAAPATLWYCMVTTQAATKRRGDLNAATDKLQADAADLRSNDLGCEPDRLRTGLAVSPGVRTVLPANDFG